MRSSRPLFLLLTLLAVVLGLPSVMLGSEVGSGTGGAKWKGKIVVALSRFFGSASNIRGDAAEALRRSISLWTGSANVEVVLERSNLTSISPKGPRGDGVSLITAAFTPENARLFPNQMNSPAAVTRVFTDARGSITEADIVLNPFVTFSTDGSFDSFDLQDTLTHEIGHLLGLGHSLVWASMMFDRAPRSLGPASYPGSRDLLPRVDAAAIRALYGPLQEDLTCCASIYGRLAGAEQNSRTLVWVEEATTGRLVAAGPVEGDNSYRIEGLPQGDYNVVAFAQGPRGSVSSASSTVSVGVYDDIRNDVRLGRKGSGADVESLGTSMQLSRLPVRVSKLSSSFLVGLKPGVGPMMLRLSGTDWLESRSFGLFEQNPSVKVLSFQLPAPEELPSGEYSLLIEDDAGVRTFVPGAVIIQ